MVMSQKIECETSYNDNYAAKYTNFSKLSIIFVQFCI